MCALLSQPLLAEEEEAAAINQADDFILPVKQDAVQDGGEKENSLPRKQPVLPGKEGWLILDNGDSLPASFLGKQPGASTLDIRSSLMDNGFGFDINQIDSLYLSPEKKDFPGNANILMTNGDLIRGTLKSLDDKNLSVETTWGGSITLKRSMISSISFQEKEQQIYSMLDQTAPITNMAGNEAWSIRENVVLSNNRGSIGTHIPLDSKIRLSFVFSCDRYTQLGIGLWASNLDTDFPPFVYLFSITPASVQLQRRLNGGTVSRPANALAFPPFDKILLPTRIDIFADRDTETFYMYVNGVQQAVWNKNEAKDIVEEEETTSPAPQEKKEGFGDGLYFTNRISGSFVSISSISVTKWNGIFPGAELLDVPGTIRSKSVQSQDKTPGAATVIQPRRFEAQKPLPGYSLIHLKNGDFFRTRIFGVAPNLLTAKSKEQPLEIPLERVWGLEFASDKEIKQRLSKDDIRIQFADNSRITIRFRQGTDQMIQANSESMGNVNIQLPYIKNITFNLYNEALKQKRTMMDTIHDEASFRK